MVVIVALQGIVVLLLAILVVGLLRSHAEILRRLHELGAGIYDEDDEQIATRTGGARGVTSPIQLSDRPPERVREGVAEPRADDTGVFDIAGISPGGAAMAVGVAGTDHSTLLVFLTSGCGTCADFWRAFSQGEGGDLPGDARLVIVTKGPEVESHSAVADLAPPGVTTVMSTAAYDDYGVEANPYVILVDGPGNRVLGEGAAASWDQVANLLRQAAADAGLAGAAGSGRSGARGGPGSVPHLNGAQREVRADDELARAGIGPGHPSLYPDSIGSTTPSGTDTGDGVDAGASSGSAVDERSAGVTGPRGDGPADR
jgi:hypothetical protein